MKKIITISILGLAAVAWSEKKPHPGQVVPYKETPQGELRLHIFLPPDHDPATDHRPAMVFFFGGGWSGGSPSQFYPQCRHLALNGLVAIAAEYRTKKQHGTDPRACVMDAKSAMRWVRSHAGKLGIDPDRIGAGGGSAGGHLAAATATLDAFDEPGENTDVSCRPQALVLFNPVIDNSPKGYGHDRVKQYWESFSPLHNIHQDMPPTLFMLGTKDALIPVETAKEFQDRVKERGGRCELKLYKNQPHGFFNKAKYAATLGDMDRFLKSIGWLKDQPAAKPKKKKPSQKKPTPPNTKPPRNQTPPEKKPSPAA